MNTFALIAEGPTDQVIIERIIDLVVDENLEAEVNFLQPLRDATDTSTNAFGGWELVLEYCELRFAEAIESNDFVVVHIDTDAAEHPNFAIPLTHEGADRPHGDLINDVKNLLIEKIGFEKFEEVRDRVLFAIAVHSVETWILLCVFGRHECKNSFHRLQRAVAKADGPPVVKTVKSYQQIVAAIGKKELSRNKNKSASLAGFISDLECLPAIKISDNAP